MRGIICTGLILALIVGPARPTSAWGPVTQVAVTTAAAHVLSRDQHYPLLRLLKYIQEGASVSDAVQNEMHPSFGIDSVAAIQREMFLLQSVRGDRIGPYYLYRLGVLGKLVAQATAPLVHAGPGVRDRYYADVERSIDGVDLFAVKRKLVDPPAYFSLVTSQAWENDQTIIVDYRGGIGFRGFARSALPHDASRSVNAVADVWYTILSSAAPVYELSPSSMRDYTLGAIGFYIAKGNTLEVELAYEEAAKRGFLSADVQKSIGDLFFDAGLADRAIEEYRKVLERSPGRRDVAERMSAYYETVGDEADARHNLENAREAYAKAVAADRLHPQAPRKLLNVESRIIARDERLLAQRNAIDTARELAVRADEAAVRRDYARAIVLYRQAEQRYGDVTDEFPLESRKATQGRKTVMIEMDELKRELIANAQSLSGTGFRFDVQHLVDTTEDRNQQALQDMLSAEYERVLQELRGQVTADLDSRP